MARKKKNEETEVREWREADLIKTFKLNRIKEYQTPLMKEWLDVQNPIFDAAEQGLFDRKLREAIIRLEGWSEEDLKMKFITHILEDKSYCTSPTFVCTEKDDLLKIIAILRKFKHILMTRLIFD